MTIYTSENRFYVYVFLREFASNHGPVGSPYYIGKGTGKRFKTNKGRTFKRPKNPKFAFIAFDRMRECDALELESELIKFYGRIDLGTGCLRNKTIGGDGISGTLYSEEQRRYMSDINKCNVNVRCLKTNKTFRTSVNDPKYISGEYISANTGTHIWENNEHPRGMLGKTQSDSYKDKLRVTMSGSGNPMYGKERKDTSTRNSDPKFIQENSLRIKNTLRLKKAKEFGFACYAELLKEIEIIPNFQYMKTKREMIESIMRKFGMTKRKADFCVMDLRLLNSGIADFDIFHTNP
jgi:hypothetical protein